MRRLVTIVTTAVTLAVVAPASPAAAQQPQREPFRGLDAYVRTALTTCRP